jgi:hypothetical protein
MFRPTFLKVRQLGLPFLAYLALMSIGLSASPQTPSQILGTWRGNSVCTVSNSPCHDEVNIYRFSEISGKPSSFSCTASKIVDGKEIVMGSSDWTYDSAKHLLQTTTPNPSIRLTLSTTASAAETLDGALTLPDGTIYRRIHLTKDR